MRNTRQIIVAFIFLFFQLGMAATFIASAGYFTRGPDVAASISMVYGMASGVLIISGLVSMNLLSILGQQEKRIRQLEQLNSQLIPTGEPRNQP
jgi:hypothetical protein